MTNVQWFYNVCASAAIQRLAEVAACAEAGTRAARGGGEAAFARGAFGSSTAIVAGALHRRSARVVLLVVAHLDDADEAVDELTMLGIPAAKFPAVEYAPGESSLGLDLLAEQLRLVSWLEGAIGYRPSAIGESDEPTADSQHLMLPGVIVAPIQALMQSLPARERMQTMLRTIEPGGSLDSHELAQWLTDAGYARVETIENPGEFAIRGGIIDIFPPGNTPPVRLDLFGSEVEAIFEIDLDSMGSDRKLDQIELVGGREGAVSYRPSALGESESESHEPTADSRQPTLMSFLPEGSFAVLAEIAEINEQGRSYYERVAEAGAILSVSDALRELAVNSACIVQVNHLSPSGDDGEIALPVEPLPSFPENVAEAVRELAEMSQTHDVFVLCQNDGERERFGELMHEFAQGAAVTAETRYLHRGFIWRGTQKQRPMALVPYHELLHRYQARRRVRRLGTSSGGRAMDMFLDLQPGDFVVHRDHGIALFAGLRTMGDAPSGQTPEEYLTLEFAKGAKLHVPVSKMDLVQKYVGAFTGSPELSTLGGKKWKKQKEQVRDAVRDFAAEMLRIQAAREATHGIRYPADTAWQKEFDAAFPYEETEDQLASIAAIKRDMNNPKPMDRLVCGDVGFGKTEVAMRGAFKAAEYGKQVAVLVPTTVLCEQHERTFRERFADYPFRIESISRFKTKSEQAVILSALKSGGVDIIIGTHRLLSKDVRFSDLGLVIIDEEQRFGVEHKQKLLTFRATADVLTLSATPIPRTLHMSLLGLRDISSLSTAPLDRRAIVTEVLGYDSRRIEQAIARELAREGQVFFVHNRVHNIEAVAQEVQRLAPDARVIVGHGQMPMRQLESVMLKFIRGEADILVSTTIIESGIDIPRANTMFINDADMFGLSELHQLRGRVGRFKHRAYCYLMLSPDKVLSEVAMKRLRAIESFSMLGAGFKIALRDLEIRGAGSLLGQEQSGHIAAVGYEMYCQLLDQEVAALKHEHRVGAIDTTIDIGITGGLPRGYIPSDARRMDAYRRVSVADDVHTLEKTRHDIESAYGDLPRAAKVLFDLAEIRIAAAHIGVDSITRPAAGADIVFRTRRPQLLEERMNEAKGTLRLVGQPDEHGITEVYYRPPSNYFEGATILTVLRKRLCEREALSAV